MDTKKYEVFEKTVELSSLTKAAEELGLTQSGVSHIIAALEEEFGFPLLTRSRTGARLTPEGEKIMPFLRDILRSQEQLDQIKQAEEQRLRQRKMEREAKEREQLAERYEDCDGRFAFIAGYTDGGAPYGVMWEEVGIDPGLPFEEKVKLYHMQVLD